METNNTGLCNSHFQSTLLYSSVLMHAHYEEVFYGTDLITTFYLGSWNNVHVVALPIYLSI